jgi:alpha-tubulin suppressor-like RCC1 family protein
VTKKGIHMNLVASFSSLACHTILQDTDGRLWSWHDSNTLQELTVSFPSPVVSLASGWSHTLALTRDKKVFVWGNNLVGQLGQRNFRPLALPTLFQPPKDLPVKFIAAGRDFSMVVLEDGSLCSFGESTDGQLGQGDHEGHNTPQLVKNIPPVEQVWCGRDHVFARADDGKIYSWGFNGDGQLGIGDDNEYMFPTVNPNLEKFVEIFPGGYHNLGLDKDGCLWSWGRGCDSQLALGDLKNSTIPKQIYFPSRVVTAACGLEQSIALTEVSGEREEREEKINQWGKPS